jgi:hypothetical protein
MQFTGDTAQHPFIPPDPLDLVFGTLDLDFNPIQWRTVVTLPKCWSRIAGACVDSLYIASYTETPQPQFKLMSWQQVLT